GPRREAARRQTGSARGFGRALLPGRRLLFRRGLRRRLLVQHRADVAGFLQVLELVGNQLADLAVDAADGVVDHADAAALLLAQAQLIVLQQAGLFQGLERQVGDVLVDLLHRGRAAVDGFLNEVFEQLQSLYGFHHALLL